MTASAAAHEAHLDAEQAEGDRLAEESEHLAQEHEDRRQRWLATGLPEFAPPSPEDEEQFFPPDPEGAAA